MFNYKKIASVLASSVMVSSTVALAAAANFPAPFVSGGAADVAIVYGSTAANTDLVAALEVSNVLQASLTSQATGGDTPSGSTVTGGDFVKLEKGSDLFNLGESTTTFFSTLDDEDLSTVLAEGNYLNDDNDDFEYEQELNLASLTLTHFHDSQFNDDKPVIGFDLSSGQSILNYTLDFTPDMAEGGSSFDLLENTEIVMLGRSYFISEVEGTTNGVKMTLLDSANTFTVKEGETVTATVGDKSYSVSIEAISGDASDPEVKLNIDGALTNKMEEGETQKIAGGDIHVGIKDISIRDVAGTVGSVEFSLGTGEIVLENGQEVEINDDQISDFEDAHGYSSRITTYITNSSTNIDELKLEWKLNDDAWVAPGTDLVMHGFNVIKLSVGAFNTPMKEMTTLDDDGDSVRLKTTVKEGDVSFSILYANSSVTGFAGLGESATHKLVTNGSTSSTVRLNEENDTYFVATWISGDEAQSYVYELGSITSESGRNKTTLDNLASGGSDLTLTEVGDTEDRDRIRFTLVTAHDLAGTASIKVEPVSGGTVYTDRLVTKEGLQMRLPVNTNATGDGNILINFANGTIALPNPTSHVINFTEETEDDDVAVGEDFTVTVGLDAGDGTEPTAVSGVTLIEKEEDSDVDIGYVESELASYLEFNNPSDGLNDLDITYHGTEAFADVFVAETGAMVEGATQTVGGVTTLGSVVVSDSEVASVAGKNLVVVGGSCVNSVAAQLLGVSFPTCTADWTAASGVGSGQFLIQTFARDGGKVATLVAGFNAGDTTNAGKYLTTQVVDTTVGKKYVGTSSTSAELQVA